MKVLLFACLLFLFQYSDQCIFRQKTFKPNCTRPANTIPVQLSQLTGVWYIHEFVNSADKISYYQCWRREIIEHSNGKSSVAVDLLYTITGTFGSTIFELTQVDPDVIQYQLVRNASTKVYYYTLELDQNTFMASQCITQDGIRTAQSIVLMSTNKTEDTERLENRLKSLGVIVNNSSLVHYYENCFKFQSPA